MNTGPKTLEEYESAYKRVFATDQVRRRMLAILMHGNFFERRKVRKFMKEYGSFEFEHTHFIVNVSKPMHELFFKVYDRELKDKAFSTGVRIENE